MANIHINSNTKHANLRSHARLVLCENRDLRTDYYYYYEYAIPTLHTCVLPTYLLCDVFEWTIFSRSLHTLIILFAYVGLVRWICACVCVCVWFSRTRDVTTQYIKSFLSLSFSLPQSSKLKIIEVDHNLDPTLAAFPCH